MLIALHGLPRSGKDTAADHMVSQFGFYKDSFGGDIYKEVSTAFGVTVEQLQSHAWKTNDVPELAILNCADPEFVNEMYRQLDDSWGNDNSAHMQYLMELPRSSRFILQRWATEYRRPQDLMYWVKKVDTRLLTAWDGQQGIVISDLREMHEYDYLNLVARTYRMPFRVLEIVRAGTVKTNHSSDGGIPEHLINTRIENDDLEIYLGAISRTVKNIKRIV